MRRCSTGILLFIAISFVLALTACLGKNSPGQGNQGVASVTLSPNANFSMDVGGTQLFSATARNASGGVVVGAVQFFVTTPPGSTNPAPLSLTSAGFACAGTWDSTGTLCTAGQPGAAVVTAVVEGVSSAPTTVYVHLHIDNLQVSALQTTPTSTSCYQKGPCCSQGQTWLYQALAYNNGVDITSTIGQPTWLSTNNTVLTATTYLPPDQPKVLNQAQITGGSPGITQLYAQTSGTTSNSLPITTCLVQYVRVRAEGLTGDAITVNSGTNVPIDATAVDTEGYTLTKAPLTWSTNNPEVVSFGTPSNNTGVNNASARINTGGADVTASCTPPTCNIGLTPGVPVYASDGVLPNGLQGYGTIEINVAAGSTPPTYVGWAATDQCGDLSGCTSVLFQITPGTTQNPITAQATAPRTPNSIKFNFSQSSRLYMGSDQGLMYADVSSSPTVTEVSASTTPCNVSLCGNVIAISNDGKQVVVSDDISPTPQVYIYNSAAQSGSSVTDLVLPGVGGKGSPDVAQSASFSGDQSKIFILTNSGKMFVYSTVDALAQVSIPTTGTDVAFSADSSFAYVTGLTSPTAGSVSAFSTCSTPGVPSTQLGNVATADVPLQIFPSPNLPTPLQNGLIAQNLFVLESSGNHPTSLQVVTAEFTQVPYNDNQFICNPPDLKTFTANPNTFNLGAGSFTPIYTRLTGDGSEFIVVGQNVPAVLVFNVASGTTSAVHLARDGYNTIYPYSASSTSDGSLVFVAACDQFQNNDPSQPCLAGSVHIVSTTGQGDYQQVPYINYTTNNMCNNLGGDQALCVPDLIAIKPD
ncbi:MAG TPA: hypothetical protein VMI10_26695 [Terriglobales bacterium]|nr:hypothetical protein [Terriglobales bacterium]